MNKHVLMLGAPALLLAGATVAGASARDAAADAKAAAGTAEKAGRALAKHRVADAVELAERAVALSPRDAAHRALLGRAYLQVGRFQSARQVLEEALSLDPREGRVALNLALAQIACGDWGVARRTLDANHDRIAIGDLGLAVALAGDPAGAVALLTHAARQPDATAKTRQNLALALALSGQWQAAKVVAAADTPAPQVDARMMEWASFAQPRTASDQVAHLLGVQAVADAGRPAALALRDAPAAVAAAPAPVAEPAPAVPVAVASAAPAPAAVAFAPRREVVQALPAATIMAAAAPIKVAPARPPQPVPAAAKRAAAQQPAAEPARGQYYVQLGAFESAAVARDAWDRAQRRFAALKGRAPTGMDFRTDKGRFYRLSVGGFARGDADAMCRQYRARGGACFVRAGAGDRLAQWLRPRGVQVASR